MRWGVNAKVHALPIVPTCTRLCQDVPRPHMWGCSRDLSREGSCSRPEQSTWGEDQREATFRSPQAAQPTAEGCQTPDLRRAQGAFWRIFRFTQHPVCIVPSPLPPGQETAEPHGRAGWCTACNAFVPDNLA